MGRFTLKLIFLGKWLVILKLVGNISKKNSTNVTCTDKFFLERSRETNGPKSYDGPSIYIHMIKLDHTTSILFFTNTNKKTKKIISREHTLWFQNTPYEFDAWNIRFIGSPRPRIIKKPLVNIIAIHFKITYPQFPKYIYCLVSILST